MTPAARATGTHGDSAALVPETIDLSPFLELLRGGANVLAIQGLNASIENPDFLIAPELEAWVIDEHVTVAGLTSILARVQAGDEWSAPAQQFFAESAFADASNLRITEIHYQPHAALPEQGEVNTDNDEFAFLELMNVGSAPVALEGVQLVETLLFDRDQGVRFTFDAQQLAPGERMVVVENRAAFESRYGSAVRIAEGHGGAGGVSGEYRGKLADEGERVTLQDRFGRTIQFVDYSAPVPAAARAAGQGTWEVIDLEGDFSAADNWWASNELGGSPGRVGTGPIFDVVINEVRSQAAGAGDDLIELGNPTSHPIDVSGWYLTNEAGDLVRFSVPAGTTIPAGGYAVLSSAETGLLLDGADGNELWLIAADAATGRPNRFADHVVFDATDPGRSLGRWPDGNRNGALFPTSDATLGGPNHAPVVGPAIISEVHYHHPVLAGLDQDFETNSADGFVPELGSWTVSDGDYQVTPGPEGDTIALIPALKTLSSHANFSVKLNLQSDTTFQKNAAIVFDYRGPTDFKFALMEALTEADDQDYWQVGWQIGWQGRRMDHARTSQRPD